MYPAFFFTPLHLDAPSASLPLTEGLTASLHTGRHLLQDGQDPPQSLGEVRRTRLHHPRRCLRFRLAGR